MRMDALFRPGYDITSLVSLMNVKGYEYIFISENSTIKRVTLNINGNQINKDVENESTNIAFFLTNGIQTITIDGKYFNGWAVFFIVLLVLLLIAFIVMAILLKRYPERFEKYNREPEIQQPVYIPVPVQMQPQPMPLPEPEPYYEPETYYEPEPRDLTAEFEPEEELQGDRGLIGLLRRPVPDSFYDTVFRQIPASDGLSFARPSFADR